LKNQLFCYYYSKTDQKGLLRSCLSKKFNK